MDKQMILGVDPGSVSGGLAWLEEDGLACARFKDLTSKELCDLIRGLNPSIAVIEKVHLMPKQGISSGGKFMENYGMLKGFLMALNIPFIEVSPQSWMKYYGMKRDKEETKTQWKKRLRQRAQELYPNNKIVTETADAVLIAHYAKAM